MKLLLLLLAFFSFPAFSQSSKTHFEVGASLGVGWGFDLGYGKVQVDSAGLKTGFVFIGSIYIPYWGNREPDGIEGYFDWFEPTSKISQKGAFGLGVRYLLGRFSLGIMGDRMRVVTFQNYISTASNTGWHTAGVETFEYGITGTLSYFYENNTWFTIYLGNQRPVMVGALYSF